MTQVTGQAHWTHKKTPDGDVPLYLWEKYVGSPEHKPAVLFVHGSSMASTPTFELQVPGRPDSSVMDWFAQQGFVCWCVDMEGYGRGGKARDIYCDISNGADDLVAATDHIRAVRGVQSFVTYCNSSGALCAALFAQRHPQRVARQALDAFVWTGAGAPTLEQRRKSCPNSWLTNAAPSTALLSTASSSATTRPVPTGPPSKPLPTPSWRWTTACPTAPTSTCAASCPWWTRSRSRCPPWC